MHFRELVRLTVNSVFLLSTHPLQQPELASIERTTGQLLFSIQFTAK